MKHLKKDSLQGKKIAEVFTRKIQGGLWKLGNDAFLVIIILVLFATFAGEILFYQYIISVVIADPVPEIVPTRFKESVYESVLDEWDQRDIKFQNSASYQYQSPFI